MHLSDVNFVNLCFRDLVFQRRLRGCAVLFRSTTELFREIYFELSHEHVRLGELTFRYFLVFPVFQLVCSTFHILRAWSF